MGCTASSNGEGPKPMTEKNTLRILTLGTSGCGKTTFTKQMTILNQGGFDEVESDNYKLIIVKNITSGLKEIGLWINDRQLSGYETVFEGGLSYFVDNNVPELSDELVKMAKDAWAGVVTIYDVAQQYMSFPHLRYYMGKIDEIVAANYVPTNEDIVRCRQATIGASTSSFWNSKYWWQLVDVGGHSPERSKWGHIVEEGIQGMIFFVALDDYDTESVEERGKTKMEISQLVWEEVINSTSFSGECTMLFLNKMDIFETAITNDDNYAKFLKRYPDYTGGQDPEIAIEYMRDLFLNVSRQKDPNEIYTYATCAIDPEQMSFIWHALIDHIFKVRMELAGMNV